MSKNVLAFVMVFAVFGISHAASIITLCCSSSLSDSTTCTIPKVFGEANLNLDGIEVKALSGADVHNIEQYIITINDKGSGISVSAAAGSLDMYGKYKPVVLTANGETISCRMGN